MRRLRQTFITLFVALAAVGWVWTQTDTRLVIVHTGDIHGQILSRNGVGGMAELATLIEESTPDLILDSGDMFTGTMLSDEFEGRPLIEIMNGIGYAAAGVRHLPPLATWRCRRSCRWARIQLRKGLEDVDPLSIEFS